MENKAKFIIIGLIGVSGVFIFLYMQTLNSKQVLLRERERLIADNASLGRQVQENQHLAKQFEGQIGSLSSDLDRLNKERDELLKRLDLLSKEKEDLAEKLKAQQIAIAGRQEQRQPQPQVPIEVPIAEDAYWAGILKTKKDLEFQLETLRNELKSAQINNEELQQRKSALELDLKSLLHEREDLRRQLEYNQKLTDSIAQEVVREKNDKAQILESLKVIKNENVIFRRQLNSLTNRKVKLEKKLQEFQEERAALERRLSEMETMLLEKSSRIIALEEQWQKISSAAKPKKPEEEKESVDLPPIIVRPQVEEAAMQEDAAVSQTQGKVLAINKENNFVVINLGETAGIRVGNTFGVYREDQPIATIEVIQTRKDIAACDIKQEIAPISIGDTVK